MKVLPFIKFSYKNYMRQHRYLRDLAAVVLFSIFFGGFLSSDQLQEGIWWVFAVFALILNLLTAPSVFFMDNGNTLYFLLGQPHGRRRLLIAKIVLIVLIDLVWVAIFALAYGLRFADAGYFLMLPFRLMIIAMVLTLSTLLLSLSYTYHPQLSWLIFLLLIFGNIVNKEKLIPIEKLTDLPGLLALLLPPFFEINFISVAVDVTIWHAAFAGLAIVQGTFLFWLTTRKMMQKDFF